MLHRKKIIAGLLIVLVIGLSSWGFLVHRTAHQLAVYELPKPMWPFFYKNIDKLVYDAVRPDVRRNTDKTESPKHFIDLEAYGDSAAYKMPLNWDEAIAKYSKDTLLKYGYVPYQVINQMHKLTEAFKNRNADSILFYAIDLGHYIEDANVPLHTTLNYDGQLSNQKGLHALWESVVPEIEITNYNLSSHHKAKYLTNPQLSIWQAVRRAYALLPDIYEKEKEVSKYFTDSTKYKTQMRNGKEVKYYTTAFAKAYNNALKPTINQQIINSANLVADFWYTAWVDAGKPELTSLIKNGLTGKDKKNFRKERRSFRKDHLVKDGYLRAKQGEDPAAK